MTADQEREAQVFLAENNRLIAAGNHEASLRSNFTSRLRAISGSPVAWWANEHCIKTEAAIKSTRANGITTGFIDNLVGFTAIEYEKNLTSNSIFNTGLNQVRDYMASLLNDGVPQSTVRGVLSDTVRWYAYDIAAISPVALPGQIRGTDLTLSESAHVDCSSADLVAARQLIQFLELHLGRDAGQRLAAQQLYEMLGVTSSYGVQFVMQAEAVVDAAFVVNPGYASMIQGLWANFVSFVGSTTTARVFDKQAYVYELYLLTLAKLIAANVLHGSALTSSRTEILSILDGQYFQRLGLTNLVEFDYFGWLTKAAHVSLLIDLAEAIQVAIRAFDFSFLVAEDLFGRLVAQLAERTQRLLLGQEPTPKWLVEQVIDAVQLKIGDTNWRFVDPCCGSGAFIVEIIARRIRAGDFAGLSREEQGVAVSEVITGFDIDPLAVVFAKVSWLIAARSALAPFNSGYPISIPIYHADSLFAITPLARSVSTNQAGDFELELDGHTVILPGFLVAPEKQPLFDEFIQAIHSIAQVYSRGPSEAVSVVSVQNSLNNSQIATGITLFREERLSAESFGISFAEALATIERNGRNGLWLYMIKNAYRPALVRGQFNAVISNFPWLALSKLADNPYTQMVRSRTDDYNLQPPQHSVHHLELASIFLLHSVKHYLADSGFVAVVVPNTVIQGSHHDPLRSGAFRDTPSIIPLHFLEVWDVDKSAFNTNTAAVLIGQKLGISPSTLIGASVSATSRTTYPLYFSTLNDKTAWTKVPVAPSGASYYRAEQGADVMPRTVWFHEITAISGPGGSLRVQVAPLNVATSTAGYMIAQPKQCKSFRATHTTMSEKWVFHVLTSAHLMQFVVNTPALAVLPLERRNMLSRHIRPASSLDIAADRSANAHFDHVFHALEIPWVAPMVDAQVVFDRLDTRRRKMQIQQFEPGTTLVLFGAGGTYPCAAKFDITAASADQLIVDQTLYWLVVDSSDEADFIVGMINSESLANAIRPFQPQGINGPRHVHTLPLEVLPAWDPSNPIHQDALRNTRMLVDQLQQYAAADSTISRMLNIPHGQVHVRRSAIRNVLEALPAYTAYEEACALVV